MWAKRFEERRWAVEGAGGPGRAVAQHLVCVGETVVDVPAKLSAQVRLLSTGSDRNNDHLDAVYIAIAARDNERPRSVDEEDLVIVLRMLSERREMM